MSATVSSTLEPQVEQVSTPASNRNYVLLILSLIYALNFLDRNIISILVEPIKRELHASDTAMGALTGFAFAVMYATMGIPIARWADRGNRRNIIALGLTVWSVMTALSGVALNFWHLALARVGVGIGEAAGAPPSHALISDYFPKEQRPRALAIFQSSIYLGMGLGFVLGGWINQFYGWRVAFFVAGVPGLLFALIVRLTVAEPQRGRSDRLHHQPERAKLREVLRFMVSQKSYLLIVLAIALIGITNFGYSVWSPSLLKRIYHLSSGQIGSYLGLIKAPCGLAGTLLGGFVVERVKKHDPRWLIRLPAIATLLVFPLWLVFPLVNNLAIGLICLALGAVMIGFHLGPCYALCQNLVRPAMRSLSSAFAFMVLTFLGLGMGPLTVGLLSDALRAHFGVASIRYAIASVSVACLLSSIVMVVAEYYLRDDIARCEQRQESVHA